MQNTIEATHEVISEVKGTRINTLTHENEMFHIQGKTIINLQEQFSFIVNMERNFQIKI